ncbi:O-antigen ligase family protein [Candidatus Parcubacteria bacterium]|nr:O-antigen ligase family protein [Candidatus Parcubacteria bacterium]
MLVSLGVSVLTAIYGLAQIFNQESLFGLIRIIGTGRPASTIGNASFFGGYLLLNLVLAGVLLVRERAVGWRITIAAAALFNLSILFATETRGAALGFLAGLGIVGIGLCIAAPSRRVRFGVGTAAIVLAFAAWFVWINRAESWVQANGMLRRLTTISASDITTQSRLATWRASWGAWRERFFLGWGYENYNVAFNKHFPVAIYRDDGSQVWFDRAHNIIFDVGVTTGVAGLAAYLSIIGAALWTLRRAVREGAIKRSVAVILAAGIAGYFIQNMFVFDTLLTYLLAFGVLLPFIASAAMPAAAGEPRRIAERFVRGEPAPIAPPAPRRAAVAALAILAVAAIYAFNVRPALANRAISGMITFAKSNWLEEGAAAIDETFRLRTYMDLEARHKLVDFTLQVVRTPGVPPEFVQAMVAKAEAEIQKNIAAEPQDAFHYVYLLTLYNGADTVNPAFLDRVPDAFQRAIALSPGRAPLYYELGQAKMSQQKFDEGVAAFREAVKLAPNVMEAHWNLGAALLVSGREAEGYGEFQKASELGLNLKSLRHLKRVLRVYTAKRDYRKLAETYEAIVLLEPSAETYAKLAAVYRELGDVAKATAAVEKAVELDGSYAPEAEEFLRSLRGVRGAPGSQQGLR